MLGFTPLARSTLLLLVSGYRELLQIEFFLTKFSLSDSAKSILCFLLQRQHITVNLGVETTANIFQCANKIRLGMSILQTESNLNILAKAHSSHPKRQNITMYRSLKFAKQKLQKLQTVLQLKLQLQLNW